MSNIIIGGIEPNEQWKLDGDCNKCRRKNYCSKTCTAADRSDKREIQTLVTNTARAFANTALKHIVEKSDFNNL